MRTRSIPESFLSHVICQSETRDVSDQEFHISHSSSGQCCKSTAEYRCSYCWNRCTSSVGAETFVMSCSLVTKVQLVCSMLKARTPKVADREKSKFVGPSHNWTKQSAAIDNHLLKQLEHK